MYSTLLTTKQVRGQNPPTPSSLLQSLSHHHPALACCAPPSLSLHPAALPTRLFLSFYTGLLSRQVADAIQFVCGTALCDKEHFTEW